MNLIKGQNSTINHYVKLLKKQKIKHFSVYSDRKCAIVERFNRTLKTRIYRSFTARGSHQWIDILDDLVNGYNNTKHSYTKFPRNDVNDNYEQIVRNNLFPKVIKESKYLAKHFKVGDTVRISTKKSIFQKGYDLTYSYEVFTINGVKDTYPVTYGLRDYKNSDRACTNRFSNSIFYQNPKTVVNVRAVKKAL